MALPGALLSAAWVVPAEPPSAAPVDTGESCPGLASYEGDRECSPLARFGSRDGPMIEKLRDEIIESEKARTDFIKWKLILVAAIGSAALGLSSKESSNGNLGILLALIPFVCLYVDAVCFHNEIRIMTIARFLRTRDEGSLERTYEEYCRNHRSHFSLEGFALLGATVLLSALV